MSLRTSLMVATIVAIFPLACAHGATIDLFHTPHSAEATVAAPPPQGVGSVANPAATAIGGERDLFVSKASGADDERLRARVNPLGATKLRIDSDAEVLGSVFVTWDGVDDNPNPFTGIKYNGLGGIDLTSGADAFEVVVSFSDIGGPALFSVFDQTANSAAAVAKATLNIPGGIPVNTPTPLLLPFSSFTGTTSALSNAGAILMEIRDTNGAWDLNILSVTTVPEPSSLMLIGLAGLVAMLGRRRR
jgi:hypothetical protein